MISTLESATPRNRWGWIVAASLAWLLVTHAQADEVFSFVRLACSPGTYLFSLETVDSYNVDRDGRRIKTRDEFNEDLLQAQEDAGLYAVDWFKEHNWKCALPHAEIEVRGVHFTEPKASGMCGGQSAAWFEIFVDNTSLLNLGVGTGCGTSQKTLVWSSPYQIQICYINFPTAMPIVSDDPTLLPTVTCEKIEL